jgi:crotonobetainyl-CoA:carnitine CoA-transferase CaiB-like acyl-CoA transferase
VPVPDIADLIADEEKRARGAIVPIMIGDETGFTAGSMQRLTGTPPRRAGGARYRRADARQRQPASRARVPAGRTARTASARGIRVVDFSMGWAGPICTRTLADLGADVIKIEATQYPDWWRGVDRRPAYVLEQMYEKSVRYCIMNRNKRGITLDLTRPQGSNWPSGWSPTPTWWSIIIPVEVLPKLGLGYDVLSKLNPKLVMMSMSAFGAGSANRDCRAYGSTLEQGSGLPGVVGDVCGPPVMSHTAFGDAVGGLNGCAAVLTALIHAQLTGKGQFIDLAQIECMMPFAAPWIIAHAIDGKEPVKYGNRHPDFVPHGCFPCAGADNWIVVAVSSDAMWPKLAKLLGRADWASDPKLATAFGRGAIESEIETAVAAWTAARDPEAAMNALQAAGVAAGVARLPIELLNDPQLQARGFIQQVDRAFIGPHPQPSMPFRETEKPFPIRSAPPTLGEHNREILGGMLGLSDAEIDQLMRDGIIGTEMLMEEQLIKKRSGRRADGSDTARTASWRGGAPAAPQPLMSVRGLGIRFKTSQGVWQATRKIDFDIAAGERVGIVGESGCGKTITGLSILRLLPNNFAGLDGSIMFDGVDLARCSARCHARHPGPAALP